METKKSPTIDEVQKRIGEFAILHFAGVCADATDMAESLVDDECALEPVPYDPDHRRGLLLDMIVARFDYVADGLADLRRAGLLPELENQGAFGIGQAEKTQQAQT